MDLGFICLNCGKKVSTDQFIGTKHRNHCSFCLWSKHFGQENPNYKVRPCQGMMEPTGLTFKHEGYDKYTKKPKQGETMIVHQCLGCNHVSINRIAGDDNPKEILKLIHNSKLKTENLKLLGENDEEEVRKQLFGK